MLTHERNKSSRTKRGCLACYQIGSAGKPYGYIELTFIPMYVKPKDEAEAKLMTVKKEVGLCYRHIIDFCDQTVGEWRKTMFGNIPVRDGNYVLRTEAKDTNRPCGSGDGVYRSAPPSTNWKVPKWW